MIVHQGGSSVTKKRPAPPKRSAIVDAWKDWLGERWIDWGEPVCFACRKPAPFKESDDYRKRWDSTSLERAHLIPHALDGPNTPDNFFLLCRTCHREAPTTIYKEDMIRWVEKRKFYVNREIEEFWDALHIFLEPDEFEAFARWAAPRGEELVKQIFERMDEEFGTHDTYVPKSTYAAMMVRIWRESTSS